MHRTEKPNTILTIVGTRKNESPHGHRREHIWVLCAGVGGGRIAILGGDRPIVDGRALQLNLQVLAIPPALSPFEVSGTTGTCHQSPANFLVSVEMRFSPSDLVTDLLTSQSAHLVTSTKCWGLQSVSHVPTLENIFLPYNGC
ncbi:hypothetical protein NPIL_17551 [Nephila pilipes]|uniref:Uncharacterized protein n=1 Tax=Nephila pilipes TaxID=299642 RepID=A0A8X6NK32_NEPPI|nr:hypothetical protein NPIL_17551 [Nephila pilipes]